jgi:hypothetical protein
MLHMIRMQEVVNFQPITLTNLSQLSVPEEGQEIDG